MTIVAEKRPDLGIDLTSESLDGSFFYLSQQVIAYIQQILEFDSPEEVIAIFSNHSETIYYRRFTPMANRLSEVAQAAIDTRILLLPNISTTILPIQNLEQNQEQPKAEHVNNIIQTITTTLQKTFMKIGCKDFDCAKIHQQYCQALENLKWSLTEHPLKPEVPTTEETLHQLSQVLSTEFHFFSCHSFQEIIYAKQLYKQLLEDPGISEASKAQLIKKYAQEAAKAQVDLLQK